MLRLLILAAALMTCVQLPSAQAQPKTWAQVGMLTCRLNPSIGFVIFGHQTMECRFVQDPPLPPQLYEGALNTVGIDLGVTAGGAMGWAVLSPTAGPAPGALLSRHLIGQRLRLGEQRREGREGNPGAQVEQHRMDRFASELFG